MFHDSVGIFIVVPVCEGGDLKEHHAKHESWFDERTTLFYAY